MIDRPEDYDTAGPSLLLLPAPQPERLTLYECEFTPPLWPVAHARVRPIGGWSDSGPASNLWDLTT